MHLRVQNTNINYTKESYQERFIGLQKALLNSMKDVNFIKSKILILSNAWYINLWLILTINIMHRFATSILASP